MSDKLEPRAEVRWFAEAMEERLQANDDKGGWRDCDRTYLLRRLREEVNELYAEIAVTGEDEDPVSIRHEAADVANFAMMIADLFGRDAEVRHKQLC